MKIRCIDNSGWGIDAEGEEMRIATLLTAGKLYEVISIPQFDEYEIMDNLNQVGIFHAERFQRA